MGLWDKFQKAVNGVVGMGSEMQTCVRAVEMANLSDGELMKYVNDYSSMIGFFRGSDAEDIDATFKKIAVKKVASDRGLI